MRSTFREYLTEDKEVNEAMSPIDKIKKKIIGAEKRVQTRYEAKSRAEGRMRDSGKRQQTPAYSKAQAAYDAATSELMDLQLELKELEADVNEAVSSEAKEFMKKFNEQVKMLKEDIKNSDKNDDWKNRLTSIKNMIK